MDRLGRWFQKERRTFMFREMLEDWPGRFLLLLLCACFAMVPLLIWAAIVEGKEWEAFAAAHDCKVIGRMSGSSSTGVGFGVMANGQTGTVITTSTTPPKTGYACNDGVTYWR
jgi:hypothetical protein